MTDKQNVFNLTDVITTARSRFHGDDVNLVHLIPEFVELLSAHFCHGLITSNNTNCKEWVFVNFWKIIWKQESNRPAFLDMRAIFNSSSSSRKLTQRFIQNGEVVNDELEQYFQYILSRGSQHVELLQNLALLAQKSGSLYPKEMKLGKSIGYLFRAFFTSLLILTFEKNGRVTVPGIGTFARHFKINKKKTSSDTRGGVLHLHPEPSVH
jgi:hypothetical protein